MLQQLPTHYEMIELLITVCASLLLTLNVVCILLLRAAIEIRNHLKQPVTKS